MEGRVSRSRSHSLASQSLSGSHRSRESGVGSLGGDSSFMEPLSEEKPRLMVELPVRDKSNMEPLLELPASRDKQMLEPLVEETPRLTVHVPSQPQGFDKAKRSCEESAVGEERVGEEEHSPSPFLPKRKAVISLAVMEETEPDKEAMEVKDEEVAEREKKKKEAMEVKDEEVAERE